MRMRAFVWLFALLFSSLLIGYSAESIDVSALSGGRFMTPQEALQVFGSNIDFQYYNGTDYTTSQFIYDSTDIIYNTYGSMPSYWSDFSGATYLRYSASTVNLNTNPQYITVDIAPSYSIFNTDQITSLIALSTGSDSYSVSTVFQSPSWDWVIGSDSFHFENDLTNGSYYSSLRFSNNFLATFVPMQWFSQSTSSGYSQRAVFSGNSGSTLYLWICCPYISQDAEGSQGTFTTTSQPDINVSVDVDMSETNSLLEDIKDALSGIWSGITGVFVPDQSFVTAWRSDMADILGDSFGKYTELDSTLSRVQSAFTQTSGSAVVSFPGVSPPSVGQIIPSSQVSAIPPALEGLLPHIKFAFNILATMLFINGMKRKFDEIIHGKVVTESESQVL